MVRLSSLGRPMPPAPQAGLCPAWLGVVVLRNSVVSLWLPGQERGPYRVLTLVTRQFGPASSALGYFGCSEVYGTMLDPSSGSNTPGERSLPRPYFGVLFPIVFLSLCFLRFGRE